MTSNQQRAALQRQIWQIANDVRGAVDGWDFKQYVLGTLFYRFISENFSSYIEADDDSINYAELSDDIITPDIKGLFADFDTTSNRLGNTVTDKNTRLAAVIKGLAGLDFGDFQGNHIDLFGDEKPFDAIVSNPPYSVKWIGADDPTLINDDRFAPAGVLAPKSKADFAFVLHALSYLSSKEQVDHFAQSIDNDRIAANDYNLSVSSYVEAKDNREVIDIAKLNVELKTTVAKIDRLRSDIDTIVAEIEG
ncbi:MAG: N-6 DNA methylase [Acetobacterium sp.]|jgi:type I restriction-modification system DNA methylase subunit|uniref:N-6 DNA methylase n=1 Tax=Desulfobacter sp. TaxID=2294 RepID=UPI000E8FAA62|nr:N-6 DNA methylase [Desulfobacter sp.]MBP8031660.1 N-6 DNA methylase [Acetobacterium sp.]HBT88931.1 hypothetical protein [Desulfobacter sp.]